MGDGQITHGRRDPEKSTEEAEAVALQEEALLSRQSAHVRLSIADVCGGPML